MQFLLEREALASSTANEHPVITRIPPIRDGYVEAQDRTKRVLDAGAYGLVFPHVDSAEDAVHGARSMRYRPEGLRPEGTGDAPRYWGMDEASYVRKADVWPLNPDGELVNVVLIEDKAGIAKAREIVSAEGVTVAIPGPGDLNRAYEGDREAVEAAIQTTLAACKEFDVVCGITAGPDDIEKRLDEGFRFFIVTSPETIAVGRRVSGR
jgi:4-hydroxy-2-oxoheptanedioate aldolase